MNLHAPQIIYLALMLFGLGVELAKHGQPKKGNHSFPWTLFGAAIVFVLLAWGGFFGPIRFSH